MVDVRHSSAFGSVLDRVASLLLSADEENDSSAASDLLDEGLGLSQQNLGAEQVSDVDAFALAEDVTTHLWIPTARLVPEVDSSLQQFPQSDRVCGGGHTYSLG